MIDKIHIENFRSIQQMDMEGLSRFTLVSGKNNVGKSSLLEAIFLMMDHSSPDSFLSLGSFRSSTGSGASYLWNPLFYNLDTDRIITIGLTEGGVEERLLYRKDTNFLPYSVSGLPDSALDDFRSASKAGYTLEFDYKSKNYIESGHFSINGMQILRNLEKTSLEKNEIKQLMPTRYLNSRTSRDYTFLLNEISKIELRGQKDKIIALLKIIDNSIEDIVTLSVDGTAQLYVRSGGHLLPLQYAGDGVVGMLNIILAIEENPDGLVLIDEIESGFHYSAYEKLCEAIDKISEDFNCQVIATTHSYEFINGASDGVKNGKDFSFFRLGHRKGRTAAYRYDYEMLKSALKYDMEVR